MFYDAEELNKWQRMLHHTIYLQYLYFVTPFIYLFYLISVKDALCRFVISKFFLTNIHSLSL